MSTIIILQFTELASRDNTLNASVLDNPDGLLK
jgi:hypothetical protein